MTKTITLAFTADEITTIIIGIARKRNDLRHDLDKKMRFGELAHAADRRKRIMTVKLTDDNKIGGIV